MRSQLRGRNLPFYVIVLDSRFVHVSAGRVVSPPNRGAPAEEEACERDLRRAANHADKIYGAWDRSIHRGSWCFPGKDYPSRRFN